MWLAANFYIHFGWEIRISTAVGRRPKEAGTALFRRAQAASDPDRGLLNFFDYAEWKGGPDALAEGSRIPGSSKGEVSADQVQVLEPFLPSLLQLRRL